MEQPKPAEKKESAIIRFFRKLFISPKGKLYTKAGEKVGLLKKEVVEEAKELKEDAMKMKIPEALLKKQSSSNRGDDYTRSLAAGLGASSFGKGVANLAKGIPQGMLLSGARKTVAPLEAATADEVTKLKKILKTDAQVHVWKNKTPVSLGYPSRGSRLQGGIAFNRQMSPGRVKALRRKGLNPIPNLVAVSPDMNKLPIIAHELGHSAKQFRMPAGKLFYMAGKAAPAVGVLVAGFADPDSKKSKYAPLGVGLASMPVLYEEGRASTLGYKALKKSDASKKVLRAARGSLSKAYGTYLVGAAGAVGATMLARKARQLLKTKEPKLPIKVKV